MIEMKISAAAKPYLIAERGSISGIKNFHEWKSVYFRYLQHTLNTVTNHIGRDKIIIEIGSGIGALAMLMIRHLGCYVIMVDGANDQPIVKAHDQTFSNNKVSERFMAENGIGRRWYKRITPEDFNEPLDADAVVSFASWCFHYPPSIYFYRVQQSLSDGGRLLIDVRTKTKWREEFYGPFGELGILDHEKKYQRILYERWASH